MTDEAISENQDIEPIAEEQTQDAPPENVETAPERTFTQTEAGQLAARVKREAYERGMRDAQAAHQSEISQASQGSETEDERINRLVDQRAEHLARKEVGKKIAGEFLGKMETAKEKYPDIENMVEELRLVSDEHAHIIPWLNGLENTADVLAELYENPSKFASILGLAQNLPHTLPRELHKLSVAIKRNAEAKKIPIPNEPLSQIKPSSGKTDSGDMTISDRRKQSWARG